MATADLLLLDEVLNKLEHLLVENNGKLVRAYNEQLEDLQRNLKITLNLFKEDANSKRIVEYVCEENEISAIKEVLMGTVSWANQLLDQCSQSGNGVLGRCKNRFHQHFMGRRRLSKLNQQLCRLNQCFDDTKTPILIRMQQILDHMQQIVDHIKRLVAPAKSQPATN